jgi:hypothetical protein
MSLRERLVEQIELERRKNEAHETAYHESYEQGRVAGAKWAAIGANLEDARRVNEWNKRRDAPTDGVVATVLPSLNIAACVEEFNRSSGKDRSAYLAGFLDGVYQACKEALGDMYDQLAAD